MNQLCLRWDHGESVFTGDDRPIDTSRYEIAAIAKDGPARSFVETHHYARSWVNARYRFGLYHRTGLLVGVAVYSHPLRDIVLSRWFETAPAVELGRLVLLDGLGCNGETFFVGETFRLLRREGIEGVVSFSDPVKRTTLDGREVMPGHVGIVYQGCNARWTGIAKADTLRLLPDGSAIHRRAIQKIRDDDGGEEWIAKLQAAGAGPFTGDGRAWLEEWLPKVTRPLPHTGNHRYVFGLSRFWRRRHPANPEAYPDPPKGRVPPRFGRRAA